MKPLQGQSAINADAIKASLSFCHEAAAALTGEQCYDATVGENGDHYWYEIVSPGATGLATEDLEDFFEKDMATRYERSFVHYTFEDVAGDFLAQSSPLYSDLHVDGLFDEPTGAKTYSNSSAYTLVARNHSGRIVGFIAFSLSVSLEEPLDDGTYDEEALENLYFRVYLDRIYTCKRYRGKGVASALIEAAADAFNYELMHLSRKLEPLCRQAGWQPVMEPYLESEWVSHSGKMAHCKLLASLQDRVDVFNLGDGVDEEPCAALWVEDVGSEAGY